MSYRVKAIIVLAIQKASQGVEYTPKYGAVCPFCGSKRIRTYSTKPWKDSLRVRFHKCQNKRCPLYKQNISVKSVQVDTTEMPDITAY